jgi:N-acetylglucosamine malate deacetylase 1
VACVSSTRLGEQIPLVTERSAKLQIVRILSIHAHPDDMEILAAGTLCHMAARGHSVTVITMTAGDCGTAEYDAATIATIRQNEARAACALIGAEYVCGGFGDMSIFNDDASRRRMTELMRAARPDVVLTAAPVDYHCDHEATSVLVRDACFACSVPNYRTGTAKVLDAIPWLYFMDPDEGRDRDGNLVMPEFVVDVSEHIEGKKQMLACHESQRAWLRRQHGMDNYIETMEVWTRERGALAGVVYGEGFRQYRCHPYPQSPALQDLLGALVRKLA